MTDKVWYYAVEGGRRGPFTFREIQEIAKTGGFGKEDLVWEPAFGNDWIKAGQVKDLFPPEDAAPQRRERHHYYREPPAVPDPFLETIIPLYGLQGFTPSAFLAASMAFQRMKRVLFLPFDLFRWMSLGFCSWLCTVGTGYGLNLRQNISAGKGKLLTQQDALAQFKMFFDSSYDKVAAAFHNTSTLVQMGIYAAIFIAVGLWLCWLRCRGDFMFLHRWYRPNARILACWKFSKLAARDLFYWRAYIYLMTFLSGFIIFMYGYRNIIQPYIWNNRTWSPEFLPALLLFCMLAFLLWVIAASLLDIATEFIVPLMYWQGTTSTRAWLSVFSICWQFPFHICGYFILRGFLQLAWFAVYALVIVGTLFLGLIPLLIPYIGAVMLLPVSYFFRGYSIYFFSQWRPDLVSDE